jgi:hypothetical protein
MQTEIHVGYIGLPELDVRHAPAVFPCVCIIVQSRPRAIPRTAGPRTGLKGMPLMEPHSTSMSKAAAGCLAGKQPQFLATRSSARISWTDRSPTSAGLGFSASGQAAGGDQGADGVRQNLARCELVRVASQLFHAENCGPHLRGRLSALRKITEQLIGIGKKRLHHLDCARGRKDGVVCYLGRPVDENGLIRCLRAALHSAEPPDESQARRHDVRRPSRFQLAVGTVGRGYRSGLLRVLRVQVTR